jgi:arylsulfatase A-like enzyme
MSPRPVSALTLAAALALALPACERSESAGAAPPPLRDVLLVTVDTLRADWVHAYGFALETTPELDALAARGVLFENAIAAAAFTAPSHASIMTSRSVRQHSIGAQNGTSRLVGGTTLAERFRAAGYETAAFVSNFVLRPVIGLDRGFQLYDADLSTPERNRPHFLERSAGDTTARALAWLAQRGARPFFLWVHYQDPHGPYTPPSPWDRRFPPVPVSGHDRELPLLPTNAGTGGIPRYQALAGEDLPSHYGALYAGEIAYADHWIGRLVAAAEARAGDRGLVVLLTADHGESLGEQGFYFQHGQATTPELARVPFLLLAPGLRPERRSEGVHHVDVMPTLLELAGLPPAPEASGLSLAPFLRADQPIPERPLFCDVGDEVGVYQGDDYERIRGSVELWSDWEAGRSEAPGSPPDSLLVLDAFRRPSRSEAVWRKQAAPDGLSPAVRDYLVQETPVAPLAEEPSQEDQARLRALGYLPPEDGEDADQRP